ncbi:MAG: hypothetical protein LBC92_04330 [Rickettsiales bacterium]|jgi:cell division protein ZapA (FtsZ GTPase activity inhibitor)|nr:hypothetical protein [Rickettsiales bacterium]
MTKINLNISTIEKTINVSDGDENKMLNIVEEINKDIMNLKSKVGRLDDLLLLFSLLLILTNKKKNIFLDFENGLIDILKEMSVILQNIKISTGCSTDIGECLMYLSIYLKDMTQEIKTDNQIKTENTLNSLNDENICKMFDEIITYVKQIISEINDSVI